MRLCVLTRPTHTTIVSQVTLGRLTDCVNQQVLQEASASERYHVTSLSFLQQNRHCVYLELFKHCQNSTHFSRNN